MMAVHFERQLEDEKQKKDNRKIDEALPAHARGHAFGEVAETRSNAAVHKCE